MNRLFSLLLCAAITGSVQAAEAANDEQRLLGNARQLIFEGRRSGEGYFSADGSRMIFQSERAPDNPFYQIYLMDLETGDTTRVSPGTGKTTCAWIHPGADKVLFASSHEDPEATDKQRNELEQRAAGKARRYSWSFDEYYDIYEADSRGEGLKNLTRSPGYDAEGSWSPDGSSIVFASNRHAYAGDLGEEEQKILAEDQSYFMDIYLMDAGGGNTRRLTDEPGYDGGPFFSPDGARIVWRHFSRDGATAEVWTMHTDGSDKRRITDLGVMSWAPFYHPSGDYIVFTNNAHGYGNFELYIVDSAGKQDSVRVTYTEGFDGLPVFSPDGRKLSWTSSRGAERKAQIFIADWNDDEARRLLALDGEPEPGGNGEIDAAKPDPALTDSAITPEDLRLHVEYLASEQLQGRLAGSAGERLAAEYVAAVFEALGLLPAGDDGAYFQRFEFTAGVSLAPGNRLAPGAGVQAFELDTDWRPLAFSSPGDVALDEIVFAGYGLVAPATDEFPAYDSYEGLDVTGRWVMVLRLLPENISPERRQQLANYSGLRYKAMIARDKGAKGLIVVSGPNAAVEQQLVALSFDAALGGSPLAAISVSDAAAEKILSHAEKNLQTLQDALDGGEPVAGFSFALPGLRASIALNYEKRTGRNVLGRLATGAPASAPLVAVGAHLDHLGRGGGMNSLARAEERGGIHYGADDNASGVAGVFEIAQYLADLQNRGELQAGRDVLFAAWSGEELGLLGSGHFVQQLAPGEGADELPARIAAYLNLDMVGRLEQRLYLQGVGSSSVWPGEIERRNAPLGLAVSTQQDSYLPTDATSFYLKGVPVLNAFTGVHEDYNTPRDTADKINYDGAARTARLIALITRSLARRAEAPDYIAMEKPAGAPGRSELRAYLGTIPAYGDSDTEGVRLSGVSKGSPAEQAGLRAGDVIVEVAGRAVANIYDYSASLNALKIGQPAAVGVRRAGQRLSVTVTPTPRE